MALAQIDYGPIIPLTSCAGCGPAGTGEKLKVTNTESGDSFLATITNVTPTAGGSVYTLTYDSDDYSGPCLNACNTSVECATCCDEIDLSQAMIPFANITDGCDGVVGCLDTTDDGLIDVLGIAAADVDGLCDAVLDCITADPQTVADALETLDFDCSALPTL